MENEAVITLQYKEKSTVLSDKNRKEYTYTYDDLYRITSIDNTDPEGYVTH
jgi:hypothetical protein